MKSIVHAFCLSGLLTLSTAGAAGSPSQAALKLEIQARPIDEALNEFARQSGLQVFFLASDASKQLISTALSGTFSPQEALKRLLSNTGLDYEYLDARTVAIRAPKPKTASNDAALHAAGESNNELRLAQGTATTTDEGGLDERQQGDTTVAENKQSDSRQMTEVVVTGTHIRGSAPVGANVIILDRDYIEKSGYATIQDVLRTLPQNGPGPSDTFLGGGDVKYNEGNFGLGSGVNLRGLGPGATLVLVDGVRQSASGQRANFVDISSIPLAAVERIEVLPDGAAALYGSDAIGGVVNVVLRKNYNGFETRARFGTMSGDASETSVAQLFGTTWSTGRLLAGYEYYERDSLRAADRSYSANSDQTRNGGDNFSSYFANPGNILCPFGRSDCLPGQPVYGIPSGQDGSGLTPIQVQSTPVHLENANNWSPLLPEQKHHSFFADISHDIGEMVNLSASARYTTRPVEYQTILNTFVTVPSTNPYFIDPFGGSQSVDVAYSFQRDLNPINKGRTNTLTGTLGGSVKLGRGWRAQLTNSYSQETLRYIGSNLDRTALAAALSDTNAVTAFNPFGDGSNTNSATLGTFLRLDRLGARSRSRESGVAADGGLFRLPGGEVKLAVGVSYRDEKLDTQVSPGDDATRVPDLNRTNRAAFSEITVPVIGRENGFRGAKEVSLSAAGRYEDYSDWGSSVVPKFGLNWRPIDSLKLRGTWGRSFKAPTLVQRDTKVFYPLSTSASVIPDPQHGGGDVLVLETNGGNPNLREERGVEWTVGMDVQLVAMPGTNVSLTYFNSTYSNRVGIGGTPGRASFILYEENLWAPIIHRNPTVELLDQVCVGGNLAPPAEVCREAQSQITAVIDYRLQNIALTKVSGLDLGISNTIDTNLGALSFLLSGTYTFNNEFALAESTPPVDVLDTVTNPLSLRLRAAASWDYRGASIQGVFNYSPSYDDPLSGLTGTPRSVSSWATVDLNASYRPAFASGWLQGTQASISILNLFDRDPPYVNSQAGFDGSNANPYGRVLSLELVKGWGAR